MRYTMWKPLGHCVGRLNVAKSAINHKALIPFKINESIKFLNGYTLVLSFKFKLYVCM